MTASDHRADDPADQRLAGMVALVTGAGGGAKGGIGAGVARCLARAGARVAVNDLTLASAEATVLQLRQIGVDAWPVLGDVSEPAAAAAMVAGTAEHFGHLDILVNNAGIRGHSVVEDMSDAQWFKVLGVNLTGPFLTSRAAVRLMRPRGFGRIVNISSLAGQLATAVSGAAYTATKSGLLGFTRHLAVEVADQGITVNAIMPGYTHVPFMDDNFSPEALAAIARTVPAQVLGSVACLGALAVFLASRESDYITGAAVMADGGLSLIAGDYTAVRSTRAASAINAR